MTLCLSNYESELDCLIFFVSLFKAVTLSDDADKNISLFTVNP